MPRDSLLDVRDDNERPVFPHAVEPAPGESLSGYLRRYGSTNGFSDLSLFYSTIGIRYGRPLHAKPQRLAHELGISSDQLERITPCDRPSDPLLDRRFDRIHIDPICPSCLSGERVYRQEWRHALVSACTLHQTRLVDTCPRCDTKTSVHRGSLGTCECSFDLANVIGAKADSAEIAVARALCGHAIDGASCPPSLRSSRPWDVGRFLLGLRHRPGEDRTGKPGKVPLPKTVEDAVQFAHRVGPMLQTWPAGFIDEVSQRLASAGEIGKSAPEILGWWYQHIIRFRDDAYSSFRDEMEVAIRASFGGPYAGHGRTRDEFVSATEAARILGVRAERIVDAVSRQSLTGQIHVAGVGHRHTMVQRRDIETTLKNRARFLDATAARSFLRIGKAQFALLREAGVITEVARAERPVLVDGGYDQKSLDSLVARVSKASCAEISGPWTSFKDLTLRRTTDRAALISLFKDIAAGDVPVLAPSGICRLADFAFPETEIRRRLERQRSSHCLTSTEVAELAGWKPEVVTHWCKEGLLRATKIPNGRAAAWQISLPDLIAFQSEFIPVADLASKLHTSSRKLLANARRFGVSSYGSKASGKSSRGHLLRISEIYRLRFGD